MPYLILIRHGKTDDNKFGICPGKKNDLPLNADGIRQINNIADSLKKIKVETIYSSPARRARETAGIIKTHHEKGIIFENNLNEVNFGLFDGKNFQLLRKNYPEIFNNWDNYPEKTKFPEGESMRGAYRRAGIIIKDILKKMLIKMAENKDNQNDVLVISHEVMIILMLMKLLEVPLSNFNKFPRIFNGAGNVIEVTDKGIFVRIINKYFLPQSNIIF